MCCSEKSGRVGALRQGLGVRQVREVGVRRPVQLCRPRCLGERRGQRARGVVAPYRVHVLEVHEGDEPDAAVDRDSLRPGDVVVARRVGSRGYRARQRHQREQRRSRQLGDGRRAGSGRAHRARRPGARGPITHPRAPSLSSPSVPSLGEASGTDAWGAPSRALARVEAPGYVRGTRSAIGA